MRTFKLVRKVDVSGVSGTGVVAEGVVFHDGQVVLSWFGRLHTIEVAPDIKAVEEIHGHEGRTVIEWDEYHPEWLMPSIISDLRSAGCKCSKPLLGWTPRQGPRCRLCCTEAGGLKQ